MSCQPHDSGQPHDSVTNGLAITFSHSRLDPALLALSAALGRAQAAATGATRQSHCAVEGCRHGHVLPALAGGGQATPCSRPHERAAQQAAHHGLLLPSLATVPHHDSGQGSGWSQSHGVLDGTQHQGLLCGVAAADCQVPEARGARCRAPSLCRTQGAVAAVEEGSQTPERASGGRASHHKSPKQPAGLCSCSVMAGPTAAAAALHTGCGTSSGANAEPFPGGCVCKPAPKCCSSPPGGAGHAEGIELLQQRHPGTQLEQLAAGCCRKQAAVKHALGFWLHQRLSRAWGSWQQLVVMAHDNHALAIEQAARVLARQLKGLWLEWRQWLARHQAKAQLAAQHAQRIQAGVAVRCVQAWRASVSQRQANLKVRSCHSWVAALDRVCAIACCSTLVLLSAPLSVQAFDQIIAMEVTRLKYLACRRLLSASLLLAKQLDAEAALARNRGARIVTHWQALARFKHHRRDRRDLALRSASSTRRRRLLQAWLAAATIRADHRHVLSIARVAANRRTAAAVLSALREAAARGITKKTRRMEALLHWEVQQKARALAGWCARTQHWKLKSAAQRRAHTHRSTRLLGAALIGWLGQWVQHQDKCAAAVLLLGSRQSARRALILREWRRVTETLSLQHDGVRRALAHWIASRLGTAFYAWQVLATARQQLHSKLQTALVFWLTTNMARVFTCWRSHVAYKGWRDYLQYVYNKRILAVRALYFWMTCRLRMAFSALRWYALHKQMGSTLALKHSITVLQRALAAWQAEAVYLQDLRMRCIRLITRSQYQVLADAWSCWVEWLELKRSGDLQHSRAAAFLSHLLLGKAWNSWRAHHALHVTAQRVMRHMLNRALAVAMNAWWQAVLHHREVMLCCEQFMVRLANQGLAKGMNAFKYHHERRQRKRLADSHFFTKKAKEVLLAWRLAAKLSLALALWTGNLLGLAFSQWSQACRRQQHLRITALTVAQRWSHLGLSQAWQSWRAFAGWRVGLKAAATAVVAKITNKALLAAWNSWLEFMALARAWNTWVAATFDKGGAIAQAQAMFLRATARMAATSLSAVFQSWRSYAARMTRLRLLLERALGRHLELALRGWRW
ncbi:uncharacterized protein HaLaN_01267, partial [Haematococcus lacustris]